MVTKRSAAFSSPSTGRLPWVTWMVPVTRNGGIPIWALTARFGIRISGRAVPSVAAMQRSTCSSATWTCRAPRVAVGSAYSETVASSTSRWVEVTWLRMSLTREKRVVMEPETRYAAV